MEWEISSNTIIVGDFNTPLTPMDRSPKQKSSKKTQDLNDAINQLEINQCLPSYFREIALFSFRHITLCY